MATEFGHVNSKDYTNKSFENGVPSSNHSSLKLQWREKKISDKKKKFYDLMSEEWLSQLFFLIFLHLHGLFPFVHSVTTFNPESLLFHLGVQLLQIPFSYKGPQPQQSPTSIVLRTPEPRTSESPGNLSEIQILWPHPPQTLNQKPWGWNQQLRFNRLSRWFWSRLNFENQRSTYR